MSLKNLLAGYLKYCLKIKSTKDELHYEINILIQHTLLSYLY